MIVGLDEAQSAFDALAPELRLTTLSPAYCAADARRDRDVTPRHLLFRAGSAILLHSVHEAAIRGGGTDWQSPYGYGGPVGSGLDASTLRAAWDEFDETARECAVVAEFLRFHPVAGNHVLYPGTVRDDRPVVAVDLAGVDLAAAYTVRGRNTLRKAEREGLVATWEDATLFRNTFIQLYLETMLRVGAADFYAFGPLYFDALLALPNARLLSVRRGSEVLSAAIFFFGPQVVEYHLSGTTQEGRRLGATNLLLHAAASRGQLEGLRTLYLGGGTDSNPENPLLRFKESFAAASHVFRIGYRIVDSVRYEALRAEFADQARGSRRVLFYRSH